jgi:hypothetical protein
MAMNIHAQAVINTARLCNTFGITLDAPRFESNYSALHLDISHGVQADFFIRQQSVGFSVKEPDFALMQVLRAMLKTGQMHIMVPGRTEPHDYTGSHLKDFYITQISTGDLRDTSDILISSDRSTFEKRADDLAALLFMQFIQKIMPVVEQYKIYRDNGLLKAA